MKKSFEEYNLAQPLGMWDCINLGAFPSYTIREKST